MGCSGSPWGCGSGAQRSPQRASWLWSCCVRPAIACAAAPKLCCSTPGLPPDGDCSRFTTAASLHAIDDAPRRLPDRCITRQLESSARAPPRALLALHNKPELGARLLRLDSKRPKNQPQNRLIVQSRRCSWRLIMACVQARPIQDYLHALHVGVALHRVPGCLNRRPGRNDRHQHVLRGQPGSARQAPPSAFFRRLCRCSTARID